MADAPRVAVKSQLILMLSQRVRVGTPDSLHIDCLYLPNNSTANDEGLFLVCSASFYRDKNQNMKKNILGMFLNTPTPSVARFGDFWLPLTLPQETIQIECVDFHGERQDVSSLGVVHIRGTVTNKLLAI